jgi:hypothetical protein
MARAGFAGSLVVDANWKGRNLNRGMRDSRRRVQTFGKSIRRIAGAVALGAGAYVGAKGILGLVKLSKAGSEAWSEWQKALARLKTSLADLVGPSARAFLEWLTKGANVLTDYVSRFDSIRGLMDNIFGARNVNAFINASKTLLGIWQTLVDLFVKAQNAVERIAYTQMTRPDMRQQMQSRGGQMFYGATDELANPSRGMATTLRGY